MDVRGTPFWINSFYVPQELNLSYGEITEDAALVVAQAVKDKDQLEKLDLNGTKNAVGVSHDASVVCLYLRHYGGMLF